MRVKKRTLAYACLFALLIVSCLVAYFFLNRDSYVRHDDSFSYTNRKTPGFQVSLLEENSSFDTFRLSFDSRPFMDVKTTIFGLLVMPHAADDIPGVLLLPGGGVTKEQELSHCRLIASFGYACFVIDQRGIGETGGPYPSFEDDYRLFMQGHEPIQHLSVYDALAAFDVMRSVGGIDKERIAVAGLSMGARYAMIAGAIETDFAGVVSIASSGFHIRDVSSVEAKYVKSIDPDSYVAGISPRPFFMLHGTNDSKVPIDDARITFSVAKEPKKFHSAEGCGHGLCEGMYETLRESLAAIFKKK